MGSRCTAAILTVIFLVSLVGCSAPVSPEEAAATQIPTQVLTRPTAPLPTAAPSPSAPPTPAPSPTPGIQICSPLQGISLADIPSAVSNPYHPPRPGRDEPHAGVDLADRQPGTQIALAGRAVQAALPGKVAAVIADRFPFGNAVIVAMDLDQLPASYRTSLSLPPVTPTLYPPGPLTCPAVQTPAGWDFSHPALYLLYAHLGKESALRSGDPVSCGEALGTVGQTGNALNPHLHFEARVGPGGASFASLAHYEASATPDEMRAYCDWSVSGLFQPVDPLSLMRQAPGG